MTKSKPKILDLYNFDESHEKYLADIHKSFKLKCKLCGQNISASIRETSNWISHYKSSHIEENKAHISFSIVKTVIFYDRFNCFIIDILLLIFYIVATKIINHFTASNSN